MNYTLSVQFFELVKLYFISYNGMKVFHIACVTDFVQKVFIWKCNQFIALNVATKVFICKCWILTIKQIKVDWCKVWVFIYYCFSWDPRRPQATLQTLTTASLTVWQSSHLFINLVETRLPCWKFQWILKWPKFHTLATIKTVLSFFSPEILPK